MNKDEVQAQLVKFYKRYQFIYALITMGGGKTKGSLDAIRSLYSYVDRVKGIIIVHNVKSRETTWPAEIAEYHPWLLEEIRCKRVHIVHRKDVHKIKHITFDWVIWDETQEYKVMDQAFFKQNAVKSLILMSGTKHDNPKIEEHLRSIVGGNVLEISTEQGIDEELINDYRVKIIDITMSPSNSDLYMAKCKSLENSKYVNPELHKMLVGMRMNLIYNSTDKFNAIRLFNKALVDKRRLIFTTTKEECKELSKHVYYSGSSEKDLKAFIQGTINDLATIRQLKTGSNIKDFDHLLCKQINQKQSNFMQILGRLFRLPIGQIGNIYLFCLYETQDYAWMDRALREIPSIKQKRYSLDDWSITDIINDVI